MREEMIRLVSVDFGTLNLPEFELTCSRQVAVLLSFWNEGQEAQRASAMKH
jgi:hypothetical protein